MFSNVRVSLSLVCHVFSVTSVSLSLLCHICFVTRVSLSLVCHDFLGTSLSLSLICHAFFVPSVSLSLVCHVFKILDCHCHDFVVTGVSLSLVCHCHWFVTNFCDKPVTVTTSSLSLYCQNRSSLKWTVSGQSGWSTGFNWTVRTTETGRSKRLKVYGLRKWTVLKS